MIKWYIGTHWHDYPEDGSISRPIIRKLLATDEDDYKNHIRDQYLIRSVDIMVWFGPISISKVQP